MTGPWNNRLRNCGSFLLLLFLGAGGSEGAWNGDYRRAVVASPGATSGPTIVEFPLPAGRHPRDIATGPDGNLWFTEFIYNAAIGRISTNGILTEFPLPTGGVNPTGIAAGQDGNLWFTAADFDTGTVSMIDRITPAGVITESWLNSPLSAPCDITAGPDGNLWITECNINGNAIMRITPAGVGTEFQLPTRGLGYYPLAITAGPDGNLWFTEPFVNRIGRITTKGVITEFSVPGSGRPNGITAGPDGNVWFTERDGNKIGRITTAGSVTEFSIPTAGSEPREITAGRDGNLWFTERNGNKIGRITTGGVITEFSVPTSGSGPDGITAGPDGNIWFTEIDKSQIGRMSLPVFGLVDLSVGLDGTTSVLRFDGASGQMSLDTLDNAGSVKPGSRFGPYQGWTARATAVGADGRTRVLWTNEDGSASLWLLGSQGRALQFDPMPGWTAIDVAAGNSGTTHLLWTNTDGRVALWTLDEAGRVTAKATFGPYSGWTASAISDGADALTRVLWRKIDGSVGLSILTSESILTTFRYESVGGWIPIDLAVGEDNETQILGSHPDGLVALRIVNAAGEIQNGPVYSSPKGLTAKHVAAGPDGSARVLFTDDQGGAVVWLLSSLGVFQEALDLRGQTPSSLSGAWIGTFDSADFVDCDSNTPAKASFQENGSTFIGVLDSSQNYCGFSNVTFRGTLQGNTLVGTIAGDRFRGGSSASGIL